MSIYQRIVLALAVAPIAIAIVGAQAPVTAFDVISIKPTAPGAYPPGMPATTTVQPGGRFRGVNMTAAGLLNQAYRGENTQGIEGAPDWMNTSRFEIVATTGTDVTREALTAQLPALLRSMLENRFKLRAHTEMRERPVYALVLARADGRFGPKLRVTSLDCETLIRERRAATPSNQAQTAPPGCDRAGFGTGRFNGQGVPMSQVRSAIAGAVDRPVVDQTRLSGRFDVELEWAPTNSSPDAPLPDLPSIFTAVQDQLGLKLEPRQEPQRVIVVDHIEPPLPD